MVLRPDTENCRASQQAAAELYPMRRALQENEDWYQDLVEHSRDLLCIHDLEGRLLSINPAPARMLGYSVEELLNIPMRNLVVPEFRGEFDMYLMQIAREGEVRGCMAVLSRSGERRIWKYYNTLRTEGVAKPIVRGIAHDITEQFETEKRLREVSDRLLTQVREGEHTIRELKLFRKLVDESNDAILVLDPETLRFIDVNEKACLRQGYSREEFLSLKISEVAPGASSRSAAKIFEALETNGYVVKESVHRRKDGTTFPVELSITKVRMEKDYIVTVARDVSESKRAEDRLKEYERVVEGLDERNACRSRVPVCNCESGVLQARGLPREEVVGRTVAEVLDEKRSSRPSSNQRWTNVLRESLCDMN